MVSLFFTGRYDTAALRSWAQARLPTLNRQIAQREISAEVLIGEANQALRDLPDPTTLSLDHCKRQLVILGMLGSSVECHSQQAGKLAGQGLQALVTPFGSFSRYVATLAARAGVPPRDSFLSYVIWNVPTVSVYLPGEEQPSYTLLGLFADGCAPLTFSDDGGEQNFLYLLKRCAALEAAANQALRTVIQFDLRLDQAEALREIEIAILLLRAIREEMLAFRQCSEFTAPSLLDMLRPYACPWDAAETYSPPSGAHDHHFVVRDYLLGTTIEQADQHVAALFHVLDQAAQQEIEMARSAISLLTRIGWQLGVELLDELETYPADVLHRLAEDHPWINAYYRLYEMNVELSVTQWSITNCYGVKPMRTHEEFSPVLRNHEGSIQTGMLRQEHSMYSRKRNPLHFFKDCLPAERAILSSEQLLALARSEGQL